MQACAYFRKSLNMLHKKLNIVKEKVVIMNQISIKIACVFIIAMFCLTPLGAVDLNQDDNNTKYINQDTNDSSIEADDVNGAEENNCDEDNKDLDVADGGSNKDVDAADSMDNIKKSNVKELNKSNEGLKEDLKDPNLKIYWNPGQHRYNIPSILINVDPSIHEEDVDVKISYTDEVYTVHLLNGAGFHYIYDDLDPGFYRVTVTYHGNDQFYAQEKSIKIEMPEYPPEPAEPNLTAYCKGVKVGEHPFLEVKAVKNFSETVNVTLDDSDEVYHIKMKNGYGNLTLPVMSEGMHYGWVRSSRTSEFYSDSSKFYFPVEGEDKKLDPNLTIDVKDIHEGEDAIAEVHTNERVNGTVRVAVDDNTRWIATIVVTNGYGRLDIGKNLAQGYHVAYAQFNPNQDFKEANASKVFCVKERPSVNPHLSIKVDDITKGEKAVAIISANSSLNGEASLMMNGSNVIYSVDIVNGYANVPFDEDLVPGDYLVTVSFEGDDTFIACKSSDVFTVNPPEPVDPDLKISVRNITAGDKAKVEVSANKTLNGIVRVQLNTLGAAYDVDVKDGYGSVEISDLATGNYTVTASYSGDDVFGEAKATSDFAVNHRNPELKLSVKNITVGDKAKVELSANKSLNGDVQVQLNSSSAVYDVKVVNGYGSVEISDLATGNYTVTASYSGGDVFYEAKASSEFAVNLCDPELRASVSNISFGQKAKVSVRARSGLTGNVKVQLNSSSSIYSVHVIRGYGSAEIADLDVGNYTATFTYKGNDAFKADETTAHFTVDSVDPKLSIKVDNIIHSDKAKIEVTAIESFNGHVNVQFNRFGRACDLDVVNGYGCTEISDLTPGNYTVTAIFEGSDRFKDSKDSTSFIVWIPKGVDPDLKISVKNITVGDKAKVEVSANKTLNGNVRVQLNTLGAVYDVDVKEGYGSVEISDLAPGNYTATANFKTNKVFASSNVSTSFSVKDIPHELADPDLKISVRNITVGDKAKVEVSANKTLNGDVQVQLNGLSDVYDVKVVNGYGSVEIGDLASGNYTAVAIFEGDDTFKSAQDSVDFTVSEKHKALIDPKLKISAKNINKGEKEVIAISADSRFSGNVYVKVRSKSYTVKVSKGKGTLTLKNLKVGTYNVKASSKQTDVFKAGIATAKFKVSNKIKLTLKKVKVKKSAKKLTLKAILKINGKKAVGKKIVFRFKGKKYIAKTNKKGVAKVIIKKATLKKLKIGKKINCSAKYLTKTVKRTAKIKR